MEKSSIINKEESPNPNEVDLASLKALSAKTGLSVETLRLIKAKEGAIKQS